MVGRENSQIWVEKYRPRAISDVAHQEEVVATLKKAVKESAGRGDLPHLLFYGPPGTGKTSTALALCRDLFGPHNYRSRVLELNASDERGIKVVRDKIKNFAQIAVSGNVNTKGPDGKTYPCPPFKIIIMDEADAVTRDAQTALRRTMEAHSRVTRFIIICNYISRIIEPLTSRCAKFRFNPLPVESMTKQMRKIATSEKVMVSDDTLRMLMDSSEGDLRKAINTLQSAHRMHANNNELDIAMIAAAACLVPPAVVENFDVKSSEPDMSNTRMRKIVDDIIMEGFSALQLLSQYSERIAGESPGVGQQNDLQKAAVSIVIADAEKALIDGCDEKLQLYNVASRIIHIAKESSDVQKLLSA